MVNILVRGNHRVRMKSGYCAKATLLYITTRSVQRKVELAKCVKENIIIEFK